MVIDSDPPGIFNRSALRTIVKWKYKPRIVGGKAVARSGVQHLITYELEDDR
jgi:protein TonB